MRKPRRSHQPQRNHYQLPRFPPVEFSGAFQDNIQLFVAQYGELLEENAEGMPTWFTVLADQRTGAGVPLYTVEEFVRNSADQFCAHCCSTGWGKHFVCRYRYHFIVPADDEWGSGHLDSDRINCSTHLLHGLIHGNGFGHLIQINGRDGGSKYVSGGILMDLWDRVCTALRTREVTVVDTSWKSSMELRLLLGVARGSPWYGRWGYNRFLGGSFGVTEARYKKSVKLLSSLHLDRLIQGGFIVGRTGERELERIVQTYRDKSESCNSNTRIIVTLRDLLRYMLELLRLENRANKPLPSPPLLMPSFASISVAAMSPPPLSDAAETLENQNKNYAPEVQDFEEVVAKLAGRWPIDSLRHAAEAILEAFNEEKRRHIPTFGPGSMKTTMTRKELREVVQHKVRNTGLLDTMLKNICDCAVGNHIVRRLHNPSTGILEYTVEEYYRLPGITEVPMVSVVHESKCLVKSENLRHSQSTCPDPCVSSSHSQVESDIEWVYEQVLLKCPHQEAVSAVLMSKQWGKMWPLGNEKNGRLRFLCRWMPGGGLPRPQHLPEVVVVMEPHMAVGELLREAERAMRETYCVMEGFRATRLEQVNGEVWVTGVGVDLERETLTYERSEEEWEVDKDDGDVDMVAGANGSTRWNVIGGN